MNDNGEPEHYRPKIWKPSGLHEDLDMKNLVFVSEAQNQQFKMYLEEAKKNLQRATKSTEEQADHFAALLLKTTRFSGRRDTRLETAPGYRLHRFLGSVCPPAFRKRELDALHADAIELYLEKLNAGDKWGAWRVKWSMRGWMLWTVLGGAAGAVISMVMGKHRASK